MSTSSGAPAPVFSYAQAAKGLTTPSTTQATSRNESPETSEKGTKDRSGPESANASSALKSPRLRGVSGDKSNAEGTTLRSSPKAESPTPKTSPKEVVVKEGVAPSVQGQSNNQADATLPLSHADISGPSPTQELKNDEAESHVENAQSPPPEDTTDSTSRDKSTQNLAEKKSKDAEDDWEKVSVPSMTAEKEFKAAPIPVVNIWQQRKEAQAAKLKEKELAEQQRAPTTNTTIQPPKSKPASEDSKRKSVSKDLGSREREPKASEGARASNRKDMSSSRTSQPTSQQGEKADAEAPPPPVGDTQLWPTPENSTVDERRKSTSYDKADKPDTKPSSQKSHGNKWVPVQFVPTAKFETQLPASVSRRGGRGGARGGRESGSRGGHTGASGEKTESTISMGPPPLPKQSGEQDRGRRSEGHRGARGASVSTSGTRPTNGDDTTSGIRKSSTSYAKDQTASESVNTAFTSTQPDVEDQTPRTEHSSRSSSRHTGRGGVRAVNGESDTPIDQTSGGYGQATDPNIRHSYTAFDRYKGAGTGGSRGNGEFGRDRGSARARDWSRDKPDSTHEKVESWRDREPSGDQSTRRESRAERGRGNFRGRGSHTYNSPYPSSHAYTSPLPQNGFEPSRSNSHTESRSRQASQPFQPTQTPNSARTNPRSQSIPVSMMYPNYYNGVPTMSQGLPALQTDMGVYGYPSQIQMQPGIMSAMPYNDPLNSYALLSMVMTQIEYYFSIDNLCKDLFLRKHMDGQGYVPLSIIANFKRIKTLTEDNMTMDNLRYVCQQVKSVEFLPGTDGDDRLRRRDGWRDFVLPVEERFESARNDGPPRSPEQYNRPQQNDQSAPLDPSLSFGQSRSPSLSMPGSNGTFHANSPVSYFPGGPAENQATNAQFVRPDDTSNDGSGRAPLTSYPQVVPAPIRSPPSYSGPLNNIVNGHHRQASRSDIEENVFPDDQVPNINIRMQTRPPATRNDATFRPSMDRVGSNDSSTENHDGTSTPVDLGPARLPNLRGGAGSPLQLEQFRNSSFGFSNPIPMSDDNSIIYFTKDGQETQLPPPQLGQFDQTYLSLHDVAFQQRHLGVEGALEPLYSFWSDFLVDKFNVGMYQEFKAAAVNDLQEGNDSGMAHLVRYFSKILGGPIPVSERLASDMVSLSREEQADNRHIFQALRAAWRNGATSMKTIKRLGDALTAEEKAELDKSG